MESLIGKKMYGFKFNGPPGFTSYMEKFIGEEGVIKTQNPKSCQVKFSDASLWWAYPYPEILNHLVEDVRTIDEIIIELKQLISKL